MYNDKMVIGEVQSVSGISVCNSFKEGIPSFKKKRFSGVNSLMLFEELDSELYIHTFLIFLMSRFFIRIFCLFVSELPTRRKTKVQDENDKK